MPEILLGLDIGSRYIKTALIKRGKKPRVADAAIIRTPDGGVMDGEIAYPGALADSVKAWLDKTGVKPDGLAACVNSPNIITRNLVLPALAPSEIPSAVRFEILKLFPSIKDTHVISQKMISSGASSVSVLAALCPSELINKYQELASRLGLTLKYADVRSNAQAKAIERFCVPDENAAGILIDIGYRSSAVSVVSRGKIALSRFIMNGAAAFDNMAAEKAGVAREDVEKARLEDDFSKIVLDPYDAENVRNLCFMDIDEQVRQTVGLYGSDKSAEAPAVLVVVGEGGAIPGIEAYFAQSRNLKIRPLALTDAIEVKINPKLLFAAIGAAVGPMPAGSAPGARPGGPGGAKAGEKGGAKFGGKGGAKGGSGKAAAYDQDINFTPEETGGARRPSLFGRFAAAVAAALAILIAAGAASAYYTTTQRRDLAEIERINAEISQDVKVNEQSAAIAGAETTLRDLTNVLEAIGAKSAAASGFLENLAAGAPDSLFVVNFSALDANRIVMSGKSKDYASVSEYALLLRETGMYDSVRVNSITAGQAASSASASASASEGYGFSMTLTLKQ